MNIQQKGHTIIIIKDEQGDTTAFLNTITTEYATVKDKNIILDLTQDGEVSLNDVLGFLKLSNKHRKAKKSLVIVVKDFDFNDAPDEMLIVPTLQEAHDMIEMEEIERDLGF